MRQIHTTPDRPISQKLLQPKNRLTEINNIHSDIAWQYAIHYFFGMPTLNPASNIGAHHDTGSKLSDELKRQALLLADDLPINIISMPTDEVL
jgi:hypothetical protein